MSGETTGSLLSMLHTHTCCLVDGRPCPPILSLSPWHGSFSEVLSSAKWCTGGDGGAVSSQTDTTARKRPALSLTHSLFHSASTFRKSVVKSAAPTTTTTVFAFDREKNFSFFIPRRPLPSLRSSSVLLKYTHFVLVCHFHFRFHFRFG